MKSSCTIPKVIHYCWFGKNPEPQLMKKCMVSWKKNLPDYELMLWNEENFDIESNRFSREAYRSGKWAFVSDYVRLVVLYKYGGIYMDTDVEVLKSLDIFLGHTAFAGYENELLISTGIIGAEKHNIWIGDLLKYYDDFPFVNDDGSFNMKPNTATITRLTAELYGFDVEKGFQVLKSGLTIYPQEYFCPKSYYDNTITVTKNTYVIHHFSGSWHSGYDKFRLKIHQAFIAIFGRKLHGFFIKKKHHKLNRRER